MKNTQTVSARRKALRIQKELSEFLCRVASSLESDKGFTRQEMTDFAVKFSMLKWLVESDHRMDRGILFGRRMANILGVWLTDAKGREFCVQREVNRICKVYHFVFSGKKSALERWDEDVIRSVIEQLDPVVRLVAELKEKLLVRSGAKLAIGAFLAENPQYVGRVIDAVEHGGGGYSFVIKDGGVE